ncbi:hypothetical protein HPB50_005794 [Hyalomma asiaticum]|uniref:Uncharacterized protein n=1 Tax=Hyalomma asiaticum TaxID=266040 RepID=A0ACB7RM64_HYAAI|nr:hypothetical protein HPB50_005794 [Hyalomma asiaticum]
MVVQEVTNDENDGSTTAAIVTAFLNYTSDLLIESVTPATVRRRMPSRRQRVDAVPEYPPVAIRMLDFLNLAYMPAVIYLGLVGNLLSLITFCFTKLRSRTSSLYMGALAVSDSGFLLVLSFGWLSEHGIKVHQHGFCLVTIFFTSVFSCWSVWLTVSFTAERFVAVRYPLWKLQSSASSRRPRLVIGLAAFVSVAISAPLLLFVQVGEGKYADCSFRPEYERALYYLNIVDTVITFILPFLLITFMNFMISRAVYRFYVRYKKQRSMPENQMDFNDHCVDVIMRKSGVSIGKAIAVDCAMTRHPLVRDIVPLLDCGVMKKSYVSSD